MVVIFELEKDDVEDMMNGLTEQVLLSAFHAALARGASCSKLADSMTVFNDEDLHSYQVSRLADCKKDDDYADWIKHVRQMDPMPRDLRTEEQER